MKRLDLHGDVVALFRPTGCSRGHSRKTGEASHGYNRTRSSQAREPALHNWLWGRDHGEKDRDQSRAIHRGALLEASTESEWVAWHLESLGHEVIVADPGFAPMYATRSKKVKTDKRDARTLAEACLLGAYRATHRVSAEQRHVRSALAVRDALVRTRTRYVSLIKAAVRREGLRLSQGEPEHTALKVRAIELREEVVRELAPILDLFSPLNRGICSADKRIEQLGRKDPVVRRLMTASGVGPVTALAFVASLDEVTRFKGGAPGGILPGPGAERVQLGRATAPGANNQTWERPHAISPGRSGLANSSLTKERMHGSQSLGNADRRSAREADRSGRARQAALGDSLRHVAGRE
jgi:transposase